MNYLKSISIWTPMSTLTLTLWPLADHCHVTLYERHLTLLEWHLTLHECDWTFYEWHLTLLEWHLTLYECSLTFYMDDIWPCIFDWCILEPVAASLVSGLPVRDNNGAFLQTRQSLCWYSIGFVSLSYHISHIFTQILFCFHVFISLWLNHLFILLN